MKRLATAVGLVLLAGVVGALLMTSPTQAEPKKLKVSDAETGPWLDNLTSPLFEDLGPFVPQDAVTDTFYVKNNSKQPARATLAIVDRSASNELEENLSFTATVGDVTADVPVVVDAQKKCKSYVTGASIRPGEAQPVEVTLHFADVDGQTAADQTASVDFVVTLSQVGPKGKVDICGAQAVAEPYEVCARDDTSVVTALGTPRCAAIKGVSATAGTPGQAATGTSVGTTLGATGAPRSTTALLGLSLALLLAGALLLVVRRERPVSGTRAPARPTTAGVR